MEQARPRDIRFILEIDGVQVLVDVAQYGPTVRIALQEIIADALKVIHPPKPGPVS